MHRRTLGVLGATTLSLFLFLGQAVAQTADGLVSAQTEAAQLSGVLELYRRGHLEHARLEVARSDDAASVYVRAMLALRDADYAAALSLTDDALRRPNTPEAAALLAEARGRAFWYSGDRITAEKVLREALNVRPQSHEVRLALGELLLARGSKPEAELVLDAFSGFYNNGLLKTSVDLAILGRAMELLGSYQDAHRAYTEAVEQDPSNVAALVGWSNLLLSKYNVGDAHQTLQEALNLEANHPDALVGMAQLEVENSNDYNAVQNLLEKVELVEPRHVGMWVTRGKLAIYDADYVSARRAANRALELRPDHLPALTILAACDFLENKSAEFERRVAEILSLHPSYARALVDVAEYGVRVFRYHESVELARRALKVAPGNADAMLSLGVGLSRTGGEDEAEELFREAFDADPYNVRAFNMVELYEKVMPDYEFTEYPGFRLRAARHENDAINALVAPVVIDAKRLYDQKYNHTTDPYLAVEVYPSAETFAVRSVGLPNVSPHGICFGRVVVSRSPSEGNFNWKQVMWHEMAHVYHIQVSNHRVPRWFTEGLAEYETNIHDPGWQRHHDRELSRALLAGNLRGVLELDKGFTQARTFEEILRSYHQASLVIHYLAETYGFEKLEAMLRAWGENKTAPQVYKQVLGVDAGQIDDGFRTWLERRYLNFKGQLSVDLAKIGSVREAEAEASKSPDDGFGLARVAVARLRDGDPQGANATMERALATSAGDPRVRYVAMLIAVEQNRMRDAYDHGHAILDALRDGYDVRMVLGAASLALELKDEALVHYRAATELWGGGIDAWRAVAKLAAGVKDNALVMRANRKMFLLDQHDPLLARQWWELNNTSKNHNVALDAARRWLEIAPFDTRAHYAQAQSALALGDEAAANSAYTTAITIRPSDTRDVVLEAIKQGHLAGKKGFAQTWEARAKKEKIPSRLVERAVQGR